MFEKTPSAQVDAKTSTPETQTVASNEGDKESQVNTPLRVPAIATWPMVSRS